MYLWDRLFLLRDDFLLINPLIDLFIHLSIALVAVIIWQVVSSYLLLHFLRIQELKKCAENLMGQKSKDREYAHPTHCYKGYFRRQRRSKEEEGSKKKKAATKKCLYPILDSEYDEDEMLSLT